MTELMDLLRAAVEQRLQTAVAARLANVNGTWSATATGATQAGADAVARYWQAETNPDTTIRHCERDLDVLERHRESGEWGPGWCFWCSEDGHDPIRVKWPCSEVVNLAVAYGVDVA